MASDFTVKPVTYDEEKHMWVIRKYSNGKNYYLGECSNKEDAYALLKEFGEARYITVREAERHKQLFNEVYKDMRKKSADNNKLILAKYGVKHVEYYIP